jgi:hypothetical protein
MEAHAGSMRQRSEWLTAQEWGEHLPTVGAETGQLPLALAERALLGRSLSKAPLRIDKEATTVRHGQGLWTWAWTHG